MGYQRLKHQRHRVSMLLTPPHVVEVPVQVRSVAGRSGIDIPGFPPQSIMLMGKNSYNRILAILSLHEFCCNSS